MIPPDTQGIVRLERRATVEPPRRPFVMAGGRYRYLPVTSPVWVPVR